MNHPVHGHNARRIFGVEAANEHVRFWTWEDAGKQKRDTMAGKLVPDRSPPEWQTNGGRRMTYSFAPIRLPILVPLALGCRCARTCSSRTTNPSPAYSEPQNDTPFNGTH